MLCVVYVRSVGIEPLGQQDLLPFSYSMRGTACLPCSLSPRIPVGNSMNPRLTDVSSWLKVRKFIENAISSY